MKNFYLSLHRGLEIYCETINDGEDAVLKLLLSINIDKSRAIYMRFYILSPSARMCLCGIFHVVDDDQPQAIKAQSQKLHRFISHTS